MFIELNSEKGIIPTFIQDHLNLYILLQALNDSSLKLGETLDDYYRSFYGPAAAPMKKYSERVA
jgi:hypothetical protein